MTAAVHSPATRSEQRPGPATPAETSLPVAQFLCELRSIVTRIQDSRSCRAALLDVLLHHRRLMGGAWIDASEIQTTAVVERLTGPVLGRPEVRTWLWRMALDVAGGGGLVHNPHPEIRNLSALGVGVRRASGGYDLLVVLAANLTRELAEPELLTLQSVAAVWEQAELAHRVQEAEEQTRSAAVLVDLVRRLNAAGTLAGACQELSRSVQEHLHCGLVGMGWCAEPGALPRLQALADGVEFDRHSPQVQRIEAALGESTLSGQLHVWPQASAAGTPLALKRLTEVLGVEAAVTVPLVDAADNIVGSLLCAGAARSLVGESSRRFLDAAAVAAGAALASIRRHEGGWATRVVRWSGTRAAQWRGVGLALGTAAIAGLLSLPLPYRISARCRTAPVERRISPAPFDGLLRETLVAPGDVVRSGQPLAVMDGREIHWELAGVVAEAEKAARERDAYMAAHDIARSVMSGLEVERLRTRETLLRDRLQRLEVRSPLDGIVLQGSLDRRENVPVTVGQALYEIAPLEQLRVEVAIPAEEISHVRVGLPVELRLNGAAGDRLEGRITRIRPASEVRDGRNVFVAEADLENREGRWRPGMEGAVRIIGDAHPLGWNLFHRAWEYVLTRVW